MARKIIRIGTSPNDGTGDSLRETANKINFNFSELYTALGLDGCGNYSLNIKPPCGSDLNLSTCGTGVIKIGDPDDPAITIPPIGSTDPVEIGTGKNPIQIGNPEAPNITIPSPLDPSPIMKVSPPSNGDLEIGDPTNPDAPKITVPSNPQNPVVISPGNPGSGGGTGGVVIGQPSNPNPSDPSAPRPPSVTVPNDPTKPIVVDPGNGSGGGDGQGPGPGFQIGPRPNPDGTVPDPWFEVKPPVDGEPPKLTIGDMNPWRIVWTDAEGALSVGDNLRVQEAKDEMHSIPGYGEVGRNVQYGGANIVLEPHLDEPDPAHPNDAQSGVAAMYFTRPVTDTRFAEAQNLKALNPTRRAAFIKYWSNASGQEYAGLLELSPWYQGERGFNNVTIDDDYSDRHLDRSLSLKRLRENMSWGPVVPEGFLGEPNSTNQYRSSQYLFNGSSGHQAVSIAGSIDFATIQAEGGMYKSNVPEFSPQANMGYSYINIPALHTHTGAKWIGQFSSNPKRIREAHGDDYVDADGIPFWSLGYKMSTQLIENYPSMGIGQYERIPDNHAISWDVRGRVSINEANLDETLNILGSLKIQVASSEPNENGVVPLSNARAGRKVTGQENEVGIYFADGTFQYTAWLGAGQGKSIDIIGTENEVEVTGPDEDGVYQVGLPDDVIITGNLTVNGTTTTLNTETVLVEDKNIELAVTPNPTDASANGGGVTLRGTTNKTIIWDQPKDRWVFNPGIETPRARVTNLTTNKLVVTDGTKDLVSFNDQLYSISAETVTGGANLRLTNNMDSVTDDVKLASGTDITVTRTDANTITINASNQRLTVVDDPSSDVTYNMLMTTASSGAISTATVDNADVTYNPSTGTLITPNLLVSRSGVDFTGAVNALYYGATENRVTLANYNTGGKLMFEVNGGSYTAAFNADGTYQFHNLYNKPVGASPRPLAVGSDGIIGYGEAGDSFYDKGTGSGNLVFDRNQGTIQKIMLTGNVTSVTIQNMSVAQSFTIIFVQDGVAGRTLTTGSSFKYASGYKTLSTASGAIDMLNIFFDGSTYYCTLTTGYA